MIRARRCPKSKTVSHHGRSLPCVAVCASSGEPQYFCCQDTAAARRRTAQSPQSFLSLSSSLSRPITTVARARLRSQVEKMLLSPSFLPLRSSLSFLCRVWIFSPTRKRVLKKVAWNSCQIRDSCKKNICSAEYLPLLLCESLKWMS